MFVDEIQDLVGVRADLVLEILRHVGGFTVLGDPAQAIYEYQVRDEPTATTSEQFLSTLMSEHADLALVVARGGFPHQPRPRRSCSPRSARSCATHGVTRTPRGTRWSRSSASLDHVSSFEDLAVALRGTHDRTAVLCRTNAECLRVSQLLFEQGVDHRLQQEATERVLPAWLAELFRGVERKKWSESKAREPDRRREERRVSSFRSPTPSSAS